MVVRTQTRARRRRQGSHSRRRRFSLKLVDIPQIRRRGRRCGGFTFILIRRRHWTAAERWTMHFTVVLKTSDEPAPSRRPRALTRLARLPPRLAPRTRVQCLQANVTRIAALVPVRCRPPTPRARAHAVVQPTPLVCHVRFNNRSREISSRSLIPQPSIYVYDFPRRALFAHVVASPSRASPHTTPRDVARSHRARDAHSSVFRASHSPLDRLGVKRGATRDARTRGEARLGNRSRCRWVDDFEHFVRRGRRVRVTSVPLRVANDAYV